MNINFQELKERLIRTKDLLMAAGAVPIVISIVLMIATSAITAIISAILGITSLFSYGSLYFVRYVPGYLISACITAFIMMAYMLGGMMSDPAFTELMNSMMP